MNEMLPVAEKMLREYGEFLPYGGYMKPNGEIVHLGVKDPQTEQPKSKDMIAILHNSFQEKVKKKLCKAVAIIYDIVVPLPKSNRKSNAVQVCVDHADGYSAEVFFPYKMINNEIIWGEIFAQEGKYEMFGE